ncbi:hypothetical protein BRADI_2g02514v3 [Brachypodium distachyon]|uniref:Uncharacterized protein n=1 Tax=Brachypodium distachyon TaxID=15368 RepID=A0A0Q3IQN1_BRADI|nr:hypothetical protein BRADI_2g02514v3 [Brachypodium distachyon]
MPPSSWFLLVFVWWLLLALAASDQEQQEQGGEGCSAPKRCGKLNISRPFWLTDWRTGRSIDPVANMELIFYSCTEAAAAAHRDDGSSTPVEMPWFGNESNVFVRAGGRYGATGDGNYTIQGCAATVMPVQSSGEVDASHYKELIRHGFVLTWPAGWPQAPA